MYHEVRQNDGLIGMVCGLPMLMDLTEQGTHLHMRLAFVLQQFEPE